MGVVYRLTPQVKEFILEAKKKNSSISCRKLVPLVNEKFQINVSKSSVNAILKSGGLSPAKLKSTELFIDYAGAFFLKAADAKLKATLEVTETARDIAKHLSPKVIQAFNEVLIFMPLWGVKDPAQLKLYQGNGLWALANLRNDATLVPKIVEYYNLLCDKKIYYSIALRLISFFSKSNLFLNLSSQQDIQGELFNLLLALNQYAKNSFFPDGCRDLNLSQMQEQFYSIAGSVRYFEDKVIVRLQQPKGAATPPALAQACDKLNKSNSTILGKVIFIQPFAG